MHNVVRKTLKEVEDRAVRRARVAAGSGDRRSVTGGRPTGDSLQNPETGVRYFVPGLSIPGGPDVIAPD